LLLLINRYVKVTRNKKNVIKKFGSAAFLEGRPYGKSRLVMTENAMISKDVTLINALGLHARPAAQIAMLAAKAISKVWMISDGEQVDAKSIIDILSLYCPKGSPIRFTVENVRDIEILNEIAALAESGFGEN
jgi:phosphocarrier protein HPr